MLAVAGCLIDSVDLIERLRPAKITRPGRMVEPFGKELGACQLYRVRVAFSRMAGDNLTFVEQL